MDGMGYWYSEDVQDVKRDEERDDDGDGDGDGDGAGPVTSARNGWF